MRVTGFVDHGVPSVKMHFDNHTYLVLPLWRYVEMKKNPLQQQEVGHLVEKIVFAPRLAQTEAKEQVIGKIKNREMIGNGNDPKHHQYLRGSLQIPR